MKINRFFGTILCFLPGAAHLYLGLKRQGIQLMTLFFFPMFLTSTINIELFMFITPIIWFYSFFDGLRKINGQEELIDSDVPVFSWIIGEGDFKWTGDKNKLLGYVLIIIGGLLILQKVLMPTISSFFGWRVREMIHMGIIAVLFILGGIKLLVGNKASEGKDE